MKLGRLNRRLDRRRNRRPASPSLRLIGCALAGWAAAAVPLAAPVAWAVEKAGGDAAREYAVPAGPLGDALARFAAAAGEALSFDPQLLAGMRSAGLHGRHTVAGGFSQLLAGSGFEAVGRPGGGYSLRRLPNPAGAELLPPVTVTTTLYGSKEAVLLGDSAASVGVTTAEDIQNSQLRSFRDSFRRLGNVMDGDWTDAGFIIRGVSSEGFVPGGAPVGALTIDGVQQTLNGMRRGARGLWDVEQVEIYRGPQSTFGGRAAMAGTIAIKTKDPTFQREAEIAGSLGSNRLYGSAVMVNAPFLNNQVAVRLAAEFERSRNDLNYPTYEQFSRHDDLTTDRYYNIRGKVLLTPERMPDTRALLSYSFAYDAPTPRDIASGATYDLKAKRGDFNAPTYAEARSTRVHNVGLEITHDIADSLRLTSLTGMHNSYTDRPSVNEGTPGEINVIRGGQDDRLTTQEFRLNYDSGRWKAVGGAYAGYQFYDTTFERTLSSLRNDKQYLKRETANLAAFGEATYEFAPGWKATAGGRVDYTRQDSSHLNLRRQPLAAPTAVVLSDYDSRIEEVNFVPRLGLSRSFGEDHSVGVTYSQGFRPGGYGYNSATAKAYSYDPEKAENYELYYKGRLLDGQLMLNANLFYTRYSDQQVEMRLDPADPFSRQITNAASSRSWGFEIEPSWRVTRELSAFLSVGYVNTKFIDFNEVNYGDLSGKPFPEAPKWTVGFGGQYAFDNGLRLGADAKFTSDHLARFGTPPQDDLKSRFIANAQAGYATEGWDVALSVNNLFDQRYYTYFDSVGGTDYATLGAGRSVLGVVKIRL